MTIISLVEIQCCVCAVYFGIERGQYDTLKGHGTSFHCPNGHKQSFTDSELTKARRERDRLAQRLAERDDELRKKDVQLKSARTQFKNAKGAIITMQTRAKHGVCPCCHRTFKQLAAHMQSKHPDFKADVVTLKTGSGDV
jgi:hypothetical protein